MTSEDIKNLRRKVGLSQERFAKEIGASVFSVIRWENGGKLSQLSIRAIEDFKKTRGIE